MSDFSFGTIMNYLMPIIIILIIILIFYWKFKRPIDRFFGWLWGTSVDLKDSIKSNDKMVLEYRYG